MFVLAVFDSPGSDRFHFQSARGSVASLEWDCGDCSALTPPDCNITTNPLDGVLSHQRNNNIAQVATQLTIRRTIFCCSRISKISVQN